MKKVCIHQPNFLPWKGYFDKIAESDLFVILDDVQFTKGSYISRVFVNGNDGFFKNLTVPVNYSFGQKINEVKLYKPQIYLKKIGRKLDYEYKAIDIRIREVFNQDFTDLLSLNLALIKAVMEVLHIETPIVLSSTLSLNNTKSDLILAIMEAVEGSVYNCGGGVNKYLELDKFKEAGIEVRFSDYKTTNNITSIIEYLKNGNQK